jgi:hypothetical protein
VVSQQLNDIDRLTVEIREINIRLGWRDSRNTFGDYVSLLHTEVSEMVEAYRDWRTADATHRLVNVDENGVGVPKPEGVGSEVADVAIRLLDAADVFGYPLNRIKGSDRGRDPRIFGGEEPKTFGDWCAYLHMCITDAYVQYHFLKSPEGVDRCLEVVIESLERVCSEYDIDINFEVARKVAYNATRPYRHGGRTLTSGSELGSDVDWRHTIDNHDEHTAGQFPAACALCMRGGGRVVETPNSGAAPLGTVLGTHPSGALILDTD